MTTRSTILAIALGVAMCALLLAGPARCADVLVLHAPDDPAPGWHLPRSIVVNGQQCSVRTVCPPLHPKPKATPKPVVTPPPCIQPEYIFREAPPPAPAPEFTEVVVDNPTMPTALIVPEPTLGDSIGEWFNSDGGPRAFAPAYPSYPHGPLAAPEIDPSSTVTALTLLFGSLVVLLSRRK